MVHTGFANGRGLETKVSQGQSQFPNRGLRVESNQIQTKEMVQ